LNEKYHDHEWRNWPLNFDGQFFCKKVKKNLVVSFFCCTFVSETINELKYDTERNQ
jgi:hypothetical protein